MIDKTLLNSYAKILLQYSAKVKEKELVGIYSNELAMPLVKELYNEILKLGAYPVLRLSFDGSEYNFYKYSNDWHLSYLPEISKYEAKKIDARINIMASGNTKRLTSTNPVKQSKRQKTFRPISDIVLKKDRWVLALYPTLAYAQDAEMSLEEFEQFVIQAVKANSKNPVKEWEKVYNYQEKVIKRLKKADKVHIKSNDTDLTLSVKNRIFINSCGYNNMPSGEVFTGPVENSANGYIKYSFPACFGGQEIEGIYLEFKNGKVVKATAEKNENFLYKMLDTDKNARYLGEFAFGLNNSITTFIKNILFDEKIGGTIHLALGNSYPETGGKNKSALHWDMIKDLRKTGEVKVDNKTVFKKGKFIF